MALFPEYADHDATGLAALVRSGAVAPIDLVETAVDRIERLDGRLSSVVWRCFDRARATARGPLPEGPFKGVPFLLKDLTSAAWGDSPVSNGSRFFESWSPGVSTELVRRFEATGVVILGRAAAPELGLRPVTESVRQGDTRNPWNVELTPGGSSGGSAAGVAARYVPIASGGDGGGSLRIPASCCGLLGFKPSRGRNPVGPLTSESWGGFAQDHVLTRSVRDCAAMLDAVHGAMAGDRHSIPRPGRPYLAEVSADPGPLKIAYCAEGPLVEDVHPDCRAALSDAVELLRSLGHALVERPLGFDGRAFRRNMSTFMSGNVAGDVREAERVVRRSATAADFEPSTWLLRSAGESLSAGEYSAAIRALFRVGREVCGALEAYDAYLTPTLAQPPLRIGALSSTGLEKSGETLLAKLALGGPVKRAGLFDRTMRRNMRFIPYTIPFNVSGQPSVSVPLSWNAQGLPIGVMLTARFGDEATLFRLCGQLERARPWSARRPPGY